MGLAAPDFFAGAGDPQKGAFVLFTAAGWIRRRCNEILGEGDLDALKIYDLASNCFAFRQEADKWRSGTDLTKVLHALVKLTREAGVGNADKTDAAINDDYKQLYTAAGNFLTWATANLPGQGQTLTLPTVTVNRAWPGPDLIVRVTKVPAVTNQVTALRAVFD